MHTLLVVILRTKKISKWLKANSLECQIMFIYNVFLYIWWWRKLRPIKNHNLKFFHLLARKSNLENFSIYSNKFFHNFHLSESNFTCPGLRASGLAVQDIGCKCIWKSNYHLIGDSKVSSFSFLNPEYMLNMSTPHHTATLKMLEVWISLSTYHRSEFFP